jgi:hypothetical protein
MSEELNDLTLALKKVEVKKAASPKADGRKDNDAICIAIISAFCEECSKSRLLDFLQFFFFKEAIGENIANG